MSGVAATNDGKIDANEMVHAAIETKISEAEFNSAKTVFAEEWGRREMVDRWLDIDTFKTVALDAEGQTVSSLNVGDVQRAADALSKQPVAVVVVTTPKEAN